MSEDIHSTLNKWLEELDEETSIVVSSEINEEARATSSHGGMVTIVLNGWHKTVSKSPPITEVGNPYCIVVYWQSEDLALQGKKIETHIEFLSQESGLKVAISKIKSGTIQTRTNGFIQILKIKHISMLLHVNS